MIHVDLFSGIGGIALAAQWAGFSTRLFCEIDGFCQRVLRKHWSRVPIHGDIRSLTKETLEGHGVEEVTLLTGGFPCQPFSTAGKRRGKADDRHLWPEMFRVVRECRPTWVVGENVAGFVRLALDDVLTDLEGEGYACRALLIPACSIGAPHRRERCFIVAHANSLSRPRTFFGGSGAGSGERTSDDVAARSRTVADADDTGDYAPKVAIDASRKEENRGGQDAQRRPGRRCASLPNASRAGCSARFALSLGEGEPCSRLSSAHGRWWQSEPDVGRVANGVPNRVDRLRGLGNAVVPQQIYPILKGIADIALAQTESRAAA